MNESKEQPEFSINHMWEDVKKSLDPTIERIFSGVIGGLFLTCFITGMAFNVVALCFFSRRSTNMKFKVVFRAAACIDTLLSFLSIFIAISFIEERRSAAFSSETVCQTWGYLWSFAAKVSVSTVAISSLMRVVNIYLPSLLNMTVIEIIITIDATILFIIESFIYVFGEKYNYVSAFGACFPDVVIENIGPLSLKSIALSYVPLLSYLLPFPVILCCYLISSFKLIQQRRQSGTTRQQRRRCFHTQAIVTLSSFMALYLFLQVPLLVYVLWTRIRILTGTPVAEIMGLSWNLPYLTSVIYTLAISLNATLNPIIYYLRLSSFRNFVQDSVSNLFPRNERDRAFGSREPLAGLPVGHEAGIVYQPINMIYLETAEHCDNMQEEEIYHESYV